MRRRHGGRRRGIGRVEVVVLLLFALVLIGLLATLLLRGREAAERAQCAENLRRLGTAIHKFEASKGTLPPARIGNRHATWAVLLAPFALADKENPLKNWEEPLPYYEQTDQVREGQVSLFYCPARRRPPQDSMEGDVPTDGKPQLQNYPGALGDYACVAGDGDPLRPWDGPNANGPFAIAEVVKQEGNRILEWRSRIRLKDLQRGGPTLLFGDKHVPLEGRRTVAVGDGSLYNGDYPANFSRVGGPGFGLAESDREKFNRNFGSNHAGVVQFLALDNSLKIFTPQMPEHLLGKLMIRDPD